MFALVFIGSFAFTQNNNDSSVDQSGSDHIGEISQTGTRNYAKILQIGSSHQAYIVQVGHGNEAIIETKTGTASIAQITQTEGAEDNYARIDQWGFAQDAEQFQRGRDNWANIIQDGQGFHTAYQEQNGINNQALINQDNNLELQEGNEALQVQRGDQNKANLKQNGSGNFASQFQFSPNNWAGEIWEEYGIDQYGERNFAHQFQEVGWNKAEIFQVNSDNNATIRQWGHPTAGFFVNQAIVNQDGTGNTADIRQNYGALQ